MTILISTFVIAISFGVFFYLFANIFVPLLFEIPATIKLGRKNIIQQKPVLKKYIIIVLSFSIILVIILTLSYYLFIKYEFGFLISMFIGACLALLMSLWKIVWLFVRYSKNHLAWLDFYRRDNASYLDTMDMNVIDEALGGKPGELKKQTDKMIDEMFKGKYGDRDKE